MDEYRDLFASAVPQECGKKRPTSSMGLGSLFSRKLGVENHSYQALYIFVYYGIITAMAMSIKSIEAERLARELAERTGESLTKAIEIALRERLGRLKEQRRNQIALNQIEEILHRVDQLPVLDARTPEEIVGYDENGLPR